MDYLDDPLLLPHRVRSPFVAIERGRLCSDGHCLTLYRDSEVLEIPVAAVSVVLIEPGVTVTHQAIKLAAEHGTLLMWVGEAGIRVYSCGQPGGRVAKRLLHQAKLHLNDSERLLAADRLYRLMFDEPMPATRSVDKLRGIEGARVKALYKAIAAHVGVQWESKEQAPESLRSALGFATSCLYGVAEAVILAKGYSPAIGIIHSGDARSLVYDLADTVKFKTVIPLAFEIWAQGEIDIGGRVRRACRDLFREMQIAVLLFNNLEAIMGEIDACDSGA